MSTTASPRPPSLNPTRQQLDELDELLRRVLDVPGGKAEDGPAPAGTPAHPGDPRAADAMFETQDSPREPASRRPGYVTDEADRSGITDDEPPQVPQFRAPNADDWINLAATWQPSPQTWGPLADSWKQTARNPDPAASRTGPQAHAEAPAPPGGPDAPIEPAAIGEPPGLPPAAVGPGAAALEAPADPRPPEAVTFVPPTPEETTAVPAAGRAADGGDEPIGAFLWPLVAFNMVFDAGLLLFGPLGEWLRGRSGRNLLGGIGLVCLAVGAAILVCGRLGYLDDLQAWAQDWLGWAQ